jgi:hypothetical protein
MASAKFQMHILIVIIVLGVLFTIPSLLFGQVESPTSTPLPTRLTPTLQPSITPTPGREFSIVSSEEQEIYLDRVNFYAFQLNCSSDGCGSMQVTLLYDCREVEFVGIASIPDFFSTVFPNDYCRTEEQRQGTLRFLMTATSPTQTRNKDVQVELIVVPITSGEATLLVTIDSISNASLRPLPNPNPSLIFLNTEEFLAEEEEVD